MSAKYTKGPWSVENPMGPETLSIVANADKPAYEWCILASVHCDDEEDGETQFPILPTEAEANARLIASAPELLEKRAKSCAPFA